jgi:hypothetical protein
MRAPHQAVVRQTELVDAVRTGWRFRRVTKARRHRVFDTLIYSNAGELVIETPLASRRLAMTGVWQVRISVDAARLALVCSKLKKAETVSLAYAIDSLILDDGAFTLPAVEVSPSQIDRSSSLLRRRLRSSPP